MQRHVALALGALAAVATALVAVGPAGAEAAGGQTFDGIIVASGTSGARVVISSTVRAKGDFDGVGHIVETDSLPGDPADSVRDDLVFAGGTIHIVTTILSSNSRSTRRAVGSLRPSTRRASSTVAPGSSSARPEPTAPR